jgi:zinc transporter ZupT
LIESSFGLNLACLVTAAAANVLGGAIVAQRSWSAAWLRYFVAVGAGFMLSAVITKMIPEATRLTPAAPMLVLGGYLLVHLFEHTVAPHFHFGEETHHEHHLDGSTSFSALIGLWIHSFFDGVSISSGFIIDRGLGLLLFTAIVLHKAPEGFAIASIVRAAGGNARRALAASGAIGAASILGGLVVFGAPTFVGIALSLSAGVTLYVAASDLIPEVNQDASPTIAWTVFAGVVLYYVTEQMLEHLGI